MTLFLGTGDDAGDFQPVSIPDGYPIADVVALIPAFWWGTGEPRWVASDSPTLASAVSDAYDGIPIYQLGENRFPVNPESP